MKPLIPCMPPCRWLTQIVLALLACCMPAAHACTASESGGVLTLVASHRVHTGATVTGAGTFGYTCGSTVLSVLAGTPTMTATLQPSVSGLTLKNGVHTIGYQLYSNAGMTTPHTGNAIVINQSGNALLSLLNTGGGGSVPLYIATTPGSNIPAGVYTDTVQLTWVYHNICEGLVNVAGLCLGVLNNGSATRTITISMTVTNDCTLTAPPVSFGASPLVSGFAAIAQNISLLCTKGMAYTVGLSAGSFWDGGRRNMASGANRLQYDIYKANSTVWGNTSTAREAGPAQGDGISWHSIPYTARVYQDQATPAVGTYTDNVVVDVSF